MEYNVLSSPSKSLFPELYRIGNLPAQPDELRIDHEIDLITPKNIKVQPVKIGKTRNR